MFDEETKLLLQQQKKDVTWVEDYRKWREYWKNEGPVKFAYQVLKFDPITKQAIKLSEGQTEFLDDVGLRGIRLAIITSARGAGKTFALAVYIMWRIYTHENYSISSMGGSQDQTDKISALVRGWFIGNTTLQKYTLKMNMSLVLTHSNSSAQFYACSETATRGAHVNDLIIDEQASGEAKGGERFIRAALFQVSTSPDIHIFQSSTAHYHGDFIRTWNDADKLGYKRYTWTLAKHTSGEKDIMKVYNDTNPNHWVSAIPWGNDRNVQILRKKSGDDEWLVEALGGISLSSGLVLNPLDLGACICKAECDVCESYQDGICLEFIQRVLFMEGVSIEELPRSTQEALKQYVHERVLGIDYGRGAPTAFVVLGRFRDWIFVLEAHETVGLTDQEKVDMAVELCQKWEVEMVRPDPQEDSLNNWIAERIESTVDFDIWSEEGGIKKLKFVASLKKYIERHKLRIPREQMFEDLIRSLQTLTYDKNGKVCKRDDHSADALMYAISYYDEVVNDSPVWELGRNERGLNLW